MTLSLCPCIMSCCVFVLIFHAPLCPLSFSCVLPSGSLCLLYCSLHVLSCAPHLCYHTWPPPFSLSSLVPHLFISVCVFSLYSLHSLSGHCICQPLSAPAPVSAPVPFQSVPHVFPFKPQPDRMTRPEMDPADYSLQLLNIGDKLWDVLGSGSNMGEKLKAIAVFDKELIIRPWLKAMCHTFYCRGG